MMATKDRLYVSTASLKDNSELSDVLLSYKECGFINVEISAPHTYQSMDSLEKLINEYKGFGMKFIFHNYFPRPEKDFVLNLASCDENVKAKSRKLVKNALELAGKTDVDLYCFHPGYLADPIGIRDGMFDFGGQVMLSNGEARENFINNYQRIEKDKKEIKCYLGIENLFPPQKGENNSIFCTKEDVDDLFGDERVKNTDLGILVDLGHIAIASNILGFDRYDYLDYIVEKYGDRIYEVHLSENGMTYDEHKALDSDSWQLDVLKKFSQTGLRSGKKTRFCLESRKLNIDELLCSFNLIKEKLEEAL